MRHPASEQGVRPILWVATAVVLAVLLVSGMLAKLVSGSKPTNPSQTSNAPNLPAEESYEVKVEADPVRATGVPVTRNRASVASRVNRSGFAAAPAGADSSDGGQTTHDGVAEVASTAPPPRSDAPQTSRGKVVAWTSASAPDPAAEASAALAALVADWSNYSHISTSAPAQGPTQSPARPAGRPRVYRVSRADFVVLSGEKQQLDTAGAALEQEHGRLITAEALLFAERRAAIQRLLVDANTISPEVAELRRNRDRLQQVILQLEIDIPVADRRWDQEGVDLYNNLVDQYRAALGQLQMLEDKLTQARRMAEQTAQNARLKIEREFSAAVEEFNRLVDAFNARVGDWNRRANEFNAKLERVGELVQ